MSVDAWRGPTIMAPPNPWPARRTRASTTSCRRGRGAAAAVGDDEVALRAEADAGSASRSSDPSVRLSLASVTGARNAFPAGRTATRSRRR